MTLIDHDRIERLAPGVLMPYAGNARTHSKKQIRQIAQSIERFGFTNPVLIDEANGIIAGHGRVLAAQAIGLAEVPCLRLAHLSETDKRAYILADNKLALNAGWDQELLAIELQGLSVPMILRRRGVETKLILIDKGRPMVEPDQTMIRALARARRWMTDLLDGVHSTISELADAYGTNDRYVARHLPLACLSPALVTLILEGRQPVELTTWDLLNRIEIPPNWTEQAHRLGCS